MDIPSSVGAMNPALELMDQGVAPGLAPSGTKSGPPPGVCSIANGLPEDRRKPFQGETQGAPPFSPLP